MSRKTILQRFLDPENHAAPLLMGPTASGKSALALAIAREFSGEIISVDSMQFYRGLDIGTAKPTPAERAEIPHHLLDTMEIPEKSDIFRFCEEAEHALSEIRARGNPPVLAGGSGLYIRALMYGLDPLPASAELRAELDAKFDNEAGFGGLKDLMRKACPRDYERWNQHRRKLIRAYEVYLLSGHEISELQQERSHPQARSDIHTFYLVWERETLKQRIADRTRDMLAQGWIEEAEFLIREKHLLQAPTAWQALGYSLIGEYLEGRLTRSELQEKISIATWQFARRQITWFRHQHPEATPVPMPFPL